MITTIHCEGAYVTWKGQVRFVRYVDNPNTINIKNSEIGMLFELPSHELGSQEEIQMYQWQSLMYNEQSIAFLFFPFYQISTYFC